MKKQEPVWAPVFLCQSLVVTDEVPLHGHHGVDQHGNVGDVDVTVTVHV